MDDIAGMDAELAHLGGPAGPGTGGEAAASPQSMSDQ